eukprot:320993_1
MNQNGNQKLTSNLPPPTFHHKRKSFDNTSTDQNNTINASPYFSTNIFINEPTPQPHIPQQIIHNNYIPHGLPKTPSSYYDVNTIDTLQKQIQSNNDTLSIVSEIKAAQYVLPIPSPIQIGLTLLSNNSIHTPQPSTLQLSNSAISETFLPSHTPKYILSNSLSPCTQQYNYISLTPDNIPSPISVINHNISGSSYIMRQHIKNTPHIVLSKVNTNDADNITHVSMSSGATNNSSNNSSNNDRQRDNYNNNNNTQNTNNSCHNNYNNTGIDEKKNDYNLISEEEEDKMEDDDGDSNADSEIDNGGKLDKTDEYTYSASTTNLYSNVFYNGLKNKWKSWPISSNKSNTVDAPAWLYGYDPGYVSRVQGCIIVSRELTDKIIPSVIIENVPNVYDCIDKLTAMAVHDMAYCECGTIRIFNYGFHNKLGKELYCVVDKINKVTHRNYEYLMRDKLFTKKDILFADGLTYLKTSDLPKTSHGLNPMLKKHMDKIYDILSDEQCFSEQVMCNRNTQVGRKWHKINVFSTMNKKQLTQFNKKRFTLSMTPKEFINEVKQFMSGDDKVSLIPIIMFNCNGYRFEYIHIVKLRDNIDIGISFVYDEKYGLNVSGIHCNRDNIIAQHQLVLNHDCHCLDIFQSGINFLHIGNPDDDKNRYQAVKKENTRLKTENNLLKQQIKNMCDVQNENQRLKEKINNLEQQQLLSCSNGVSSPAILWYNYATPVITPTIYTPGTSMPSHYITPSTNNSMPIGFPNVQINNQMINSNLNCLSQLNNANNNQGITNNINTCLPFTINGNIKQ